LKQLSLIAIISYLFISGCAINKPTVDSECATCNATIIPEPSKETLEKFK